MNPPAIDLMGGQRRSLPGRPRVGAVLLAAGSASRMGRRPKCLLELDGVPLITRGLLALAGAGVDEIVVVLGHYADLIEPVVQARAVTLARNPDPDAGQVGSQRLGLAALGAVGASGGRLDAVIVALADQPLLKAEDIGALIEAFEARPVGVSVVHPMVGGERGNPVIFTAAVCEQILAAAADVGCRQWQAAHPEAVAPFITGNRHYKLDIDTPEDLERFEAETGHALRWPAPFKNG